MGQQYAVLKVQHGQRYNRFLGPLHPQKMYNAVVRNTETRRNKAQKLLRNKVQKTFDEISYKRNTNIIHKENGGMCVIKMVCMCVNKTV